MNEKPNYCECGNLPRIWVTYNGFTVKAFGHAGCCDIEVTGKAVDSWESNGGGKKIAEQEAIKAWNRRADKQE